MNYASTIEEISPTRRKFKISVPKSIVADTFSDAIKDFQSTKEVRGFRKGKVPATLVRKFFESDINKWVFEKLIDNSYEKVVKESNVQIVSQPQVESTSKLSENEDFNYDVVVDINPPIEIQGYKNLVLKGVSHRITDVEVDKTLNSIAYSLSKFEKIESNQAISEDESLVLNIKLKLDGEVLGRYSKDNTRLYLKESIPEYKAALIGAKIGETKEFKVTYPENFSDAELSGKTIEVVAQIVESHKVIMPEFNDEFATRLGSESLANLRSTILDSLIKTQETKNIEDFGEQIVEQLLNQNGFEVPASLIENTIDRQIAEENMRLEKSAHLDTKNPEIRQKYMEQASQNVKAILALGNVARMENINVDEKDIGPELYAMAQSMGVNIQDLIKKGGRMAVDEARGRVLINKTIKHLVGLNKVEWSE